MKFNRMGWKCVLDKFYNNFLYYAWEIFRPQSIHFDVETNVHGWNESAFVFIKFWRVKFLSFFICSREPTSQVFQQLSSLLRFILIHFDGFRIASVRENLLRSILLLRGGKFTLRCIHAFFEEDFQWRNALQEAIPCLDRSLSEHRSICDVLLKNHKGVALNGENIWRLPEPGHHIRSASGKFSHLNDGKAADTTDSVRFPCYIHMDAAPIKDFLHDNSLEVDYCACSKENSVNYWSGFSHCDNFPTPTHPYTQTHWAKKILEMNFTFYGAACPARLLNLRVIYIYCEACEIWIKNRYWYNRRSERRWTDPSRTYISLGENLDLEKKLKRIEEKFVELYFKDIFFFRHHDRSFSSPSISPMCTRVWRKRFAVASTNSP